MTDPFSRGNIIRAKVVGQKEGSAIYRKGKDKYELVDHKTNYTYDKKHSTFLPRMYSNQPRHIEKYRSITGLKPGEKPSFSDNIYYMFRHQLGHMWGRYFMWNFSGRVSDEQNAGFIGFANMNDEVNPRLSTIKPEIIFL